MTGILGGTAAILFVYSYRLISASKIASFEYFGIPSSFILGWFFLKKRLGSIISWSISYNFCRVDNYLERQR